MSKYIDAKKLRKEVKRLEKAAHKSALGCADSETRKFHEGKDYAYQHVGILIGSLQPEQQKEPDKSLEEEIRKYLSDRWKFGCCTPVTPVVLPNYTTVDLEECANHFAQWGAEHLRDSTKVIDKSLEEAAEEYANKEFPNEPAIGQWGTGDYEPPVDMEYPREIAKEAFIAGINWQKEQMLKDAVEASVNTYELTPGGSAYVEFVADMPVAHFRSNDKVRIIVIKGEE